MRTASWPRTTQRRCKPILLSLCRLSGRDCSALTPFRESYLRGDPEAVKRLTELDIKISRGGPAKLTDRGVAPAENYRFDTGARHRDLPEKEALKIDEGFAAGARDLQLDPSMAKTLVNLAFDADDAVTDKEACAREQEQLFHKVVGGPETAAAKLAAAQKILDGVSGAKKVDLAALVKTGGATARRASHSPR
jgi:hypothetical protein